MFVEISFKAAYIGSMDKKANDLNPFSQAKILEERERVWKSFKSMARPISKEEGGRLMKEAFRLQMADKK